MSGRGKKGRKVTIVFEETDLVRLEESAKKKGLGRASTFIRMVAIQSLNKRPEADGIAEIKIEVDNYKELEHYAKAKKFLTIPQLAVYAVEQHMQRYPLSEAQKAKIDKNID